MLNIEEAIASYEKSAERYHKALLHCKAHGGEFYQEEAESNKICYEHDRQLAAWLRELQERRKQPEKAQLSQEGTTSDTISRQAALNSPVTMVSEGLDWIPAYHIKELPSAQPEQLERCPIYDGVCGYPSDQCYDCPRHHGAQPEPQEGHWIDKGWDGDWAWQIDGRGNCWRVIECSECGKRVLVESNYCPNCGAHMKGVTP